MPKELKLSVYDPIVKAKREVTVTEEEVKIYLKSLKHAQEEIEKFFKVAKEE